MFEALPGGRVQNKWAPGIRTPIGWPTPSASGEKVGWPMYVSLDCSLAKTTGNPTKLMEKIWFPVECSVKSSQWVSKESLSSPSCATYLVGLESSRRSARDLTAAVERCSTSHLCWKLKHLCIYALADSYHYTEIHWIYTTDWISTVWFWIKVLVLQSFVRGTQTLRAVGHIAPNDHVKRSFGHIRRQSIVGRESRWASRPKGICLFPEWQQLWKNTQSRVNIC